MISMYNFNLKKIPVFLNKFDYHLNLNNKYLKKKNSNYLINKIQNGLINII